MVITMKAMPTANSAHIWPYAITAYFAVFIAALAIFVAWALRQRMDLVRPDYYEHEMLYQREIDRLNRSVQIDPAVQLSYDDKSRQVVLSLPASQWGSSAAGTVEFYRPSDARSDRKVSLALDANGRQLMDVRQYPPGLWKVRINWSVDGNDYGVHRSIVVGSGGG